MLKIEGVSSRLTFNLNQRLHSLFHTEGYVIVRIHLLVKMNYWVLGWGLTRGGRLISV